MLTWAQIGGLGGLVVFAVVLDRVVTADQRRQVGDFTARYVILGVGTTICVAMVDSLGQMYDSVRWGLLLFLHFAASGTPMIVGSWRRRRQ